MPDALYIVQGIKVGVIKYSDLDFDVKATRFVEDLGVSSDSKIIDYTWQYVNKSGSPDMRFKDNKQYPICLYGNLEIKSNSGLNTRILFSSLEYFNVEE